MHSLLEGGGGNVPSNCWAKAKALNSSRLTVELAPVFVVIGRLVLLFRACVSYLSARAAAAAPTKPGGRVRARRTTGPVGSRPFAQVGIWCVSVLEVAKKYVSDGEIPEAEVAAEEKC